MDLDLKIEYLDVNELTPYENNARRHAVTDVGAIVASIKAFGFDDPIGIWGKRNTIVTGHGRLLAAKQLGMDKVPCVRLDHLTDEQRRAYALAHNKTAELSEWDFDILDMELGDIDDIDMTEFGFDMSAISESQVEDDDFDPEPPEEPKSKRGEIWRLGAHRLMCGDATSTDDIQMLMGGGTSRSVPVRSAL